MIKKGLYLLAKLVLCCCCTAQEFIPLWPDGTKPNRNGRSVPDSLFNERIWQVGTPGIYAFPVPGSENRGTAVLICPGGGYERLSHIYNGFQVARWFNAMGINAYVLIYRLPHQKDLRQGALAPLQDAQRAMRIIRKNAPAWNLNYKRIGVFGTSAGGHLASMLGTGNHDVSRINDAHDSLPYKPDFMILLSPVISMGSYAHAGSKRNLLGNDPPAALVEQYSAHLHVTESTPPTFMVHAQNDSTVRIQNSLMFYTALIEKRVSAVLHTFPAGGHGINMADNPGSTALWPQLLLLWLKEQQFLVMKNN